jgi:hypothetical protein
MWITTYFTLLFSSFVSSEPYMRLLRSSFWKTFWFFIASMLLIGLSSAARFNTRTIPQWRIIAQNVIAEAVTNYPNDLELNWEEDRLAMNIVEPLAIPYPTALAKPELFPETFLYLSPEELTPSNFKRHLSTFSLFVITPTHLYVNDLQDHWSELLLTDAIATDSFTITKTGVGEMSQATQELINGQIAVVGVLAWVGLPLWLVVVQFFSCFVMAILLTLIFKLYRLHVPFMKSWQLTLHVAIVAEAVHQLSLWLYPETTVPMYSLAFWLIFGYLILTNRTSLEQLAKNK